jgi:histidine triad (HIT) family protein
MRARIAQLSAKGECFYCADLVNSSVFGHQPVVHEDAKFKVVLDRFPRTRGHAIVILKEHRGDVADLTDDEAADLFRMCRRVVRAIKSALKAERVYVTTIVDGPINHVHAQLIPRYENDQRGTARLVAPRQPLTSGSETAAAIRAAMEA